ncbi:MAG: hypothetical protein RLZ35_574 [Pseudomonadota bacterium]|jgi:hypothetical protein
MLWGVYVDFLYQNSKKEDSTSSPAHKLNNEAPSVPDQIELTGDAAILNKKFQLRWNEHAKGNISDRELAKSILDISRSKYGVHSNTSHQKHKPK